MFLYDLIIESLPLSLIQNIHMNHMSPSHVTLVSVMIEGNV